MAVLPFLWSSRIGSRRLVCPKDGEVSAKGAEILRTSENSYGRPEDTRGVVWGNHGRGSRSASSHGMPRGVGPDQFCAPSLGGAVSAAQGGVGGGQTRNRIA